VAAWEVSVEAVELMVVAALEEAIVAEEVRVISEDRERKVG
jgi:hypothetical protein